MHRKIHIDIDFGVFIQAKHPDPTPYINYQKVELNDIYKKYGGYPDSLIFENTRIHQKFWSNDECDHDELGDKLGIDVVTVSSIMQPPGNTIPLHRDTFYQIKKRFPDHKQKIVRANVFLEDWKAGHFLQYNDVVDSHWSQGDGHMWDSEVLHIGANNGLQNKYTLQASGFLKN